MKRTAAVLVVAFVVLLVSACGDDEPVQPVAATSCAEVLYEGEGEPDLIIVSDFPLRGIGATTSRSMIDAIELVLRAREFRAGEYRVGYQSCNDTVGDEPFDPRLCAMNARAYAAASAVVGIVGPWNSGCAMEQLPIVSRTAAGPLAMISPSNTFIGLTRDQPGAEPLAPTLYPDGVRSYVRVVTHDVAQGNAAAQVADQLGARRVALLHQDLRDDYVRGLTQSFVSTARDLGLAVDQFDWPRLDSYASLAADVAAARPDAVFLAGLTQLNAKRLVEDLRATLPDDVDLIAPDSFAAADVAQALGAAGEGIRTTVPSIPYDSLPPSGKEIVRRLGLSPEDSIYVPEAAQATAVLLDAIARSDGTRASVVDQLFDTKVEGGILGSFSFDRFGDIDPAPVGIYRFEDGEIVAEGVVRAPLAGR